MNTYISNLHVLLKKIHADSLYRNSIYMMAGTFIMAAFGFVFWMIVAKMYSPTDVGLATTFISIATMVGSFSMLGLNTTLIRYLSGAKDKTAYINTALTLTSLTAIVLGIFYLSGINFFSPKLSFLASDLSAILLLLIFFVFTSINVLTDSVFISFRKTQYILYTNSLFSFIKLILPIFFIYMGASGLIISYALGIALAALLSLVFIYTKLGIPVYPSISKSMLSQAYRYAAGNYLATTIGSASSLLLPVIITNTLSPEKTAYYYVVTMITNMINIIPMAVTKSLFAEGAHKTMNLMHQTRNALKLIFSLLIPIISLAILIGKPVLTFFGQNYANEGYSLLVILSLNGLLMGITTIITTIMNVKHFVRGIVYANIIGALSVLTFSVLLVRYGIIGIGLATVSGYIFGLIFVSYIMRSYFLKFFKFLYA